MRVYLAGPSRQLDRVKYWAKRLEDAGHEITYKWWEDVEKHGVGNDGALSGEEQRKHACADLVGVRDAQVIWVLWSKESQGVAVELGYALGMASHFPNKIVVTGEESFGSIFAALADERSAFDEDGLYTVNHWAGLTSQRSQVVSSP